MSEEKMVLVRLERRLWSRCKACAYRRRMGVWEWLGAVLRAVVEAEETPGVWGERKPSVEERVGALVEELFAELPPVVREAKWKEPSSPSDSDRVRP